MSLYIIIIKEIYLGDVTTSYKVGKYFSDFSLQILPESASTYLESVISPLVTGSSSSGGQIFTLVTATGRKIREFHRFVKTLVAKRISE